MVLLALLLSGCGGGDASSASHRVVRSDAAPEVIVRDTQARHYRVEVRFDPQVPKPGELFSVHAKVSTRDGAPLESGTVKMNAGMPQHYHGMETEPADWPGECDDDGACTFPGGAYRSDGFKFHMPGEWTVSIEVQGFRGFDSTSFVYDLRP